MQTYHGYRLYIEFVEQCILNFNPNVRINDLYLLVNVGYKSKKLPVNCYCDSKWVVSLKNDRLKFKLSEKCTQVTFLLEGRHSVNGVNKILGKVSIPLSSVSDKTSLNAWYIINSMDREVLNSGKFCLIIRLVPSHSPKKITFNKKLDSLWDITNNCDIDALNGILECQNLDLNAKNHYGETPLHISVKKSTWNDNDTEFLSRILDYPLVDVNAVDLGGNTPFHYFFQKISSSEFVPIFNRFISLGAKVNATNDLGETPLHKAILNKNLSLEAVELLIAHGADPNARTNIGNMPLHYAIYVGREDFVKHLLMKGADMDARTHSGKTVLDICIEENQKNILDLINETKKLFEFLKKNDLSEIKEQFLLNNIFVYCIPELTKEVLLGVLENSQWHMIPRILDVIKCLKDVRKNRNLVSLNRISFVNKDVTIRRYFDQTLRTRVLRYKKSINALRVEDFSGREPFKFSSRVSIPTIEYKEVPSSNYSWEINYHDLVFIESLGQGSFGQVFLGKYKGKEVAIKIINERGNNSEVEEFKKEFSVLLSIDSPYIINFYGACLVERLCMVMEYCPNKSLYDLLRRKNFQMTWEKFFDFAMDISAGLSALHTASPEILHRDMKTLNILVTKDYHCKLCDFGLSRFNTNSNLKTLFKCRGTYAYIAPEVYKCEMFTTKSDIYALAIVFWEMVNRIIVGTYVQPYKEYKDIDFDFQILIKASTGGLRPKFPEGTPSPLKNLVEACWSDNSDSRLGAWELFKKIKDLKLNYLNNKEEWDAGVSNSSKTKD